MSLEESLTVRDCPFCGTAKVQMRLFDDDTTKAVPVSSDAVRFWVAMWCPICASALLVEHEDYFIEGEGLIEIAVIPAHGVENDVRHLPEDVERYYLNALKLRGVGVPDALAVQLRKTLEAATAHHGADSGVLVRRIEALISKGMITQEFSKALDHVRKVGNAGAHAGDEQVDQETAERALRFTTQVLRNLFEIPEELRLLELHDPPE
jgi:hypothetical protein